ncbi:LppU/SCO3897 family protein [Amycolatopsis tolypomycina]|uniref:LppU/SCO3897 family protein n=1 Tax=Amycolatopsis tolypomycina TaxID=208445 RepID=UPI0033A7A08C
MTTPEDRPQHEPEANPFRPPTPEPALPPYPATPYPHAQYPAPPPIGLPPKRGAGRKIALGIGIPLVLLVVAAVVVAGLTAAKPGSSNVGDCLKGNPDRADSVSSVACGPEAAYKIVGKLADQHQVAMNFGGCDRFPTASAAYWEGVDVSKGTLFCLEDLKNPGKGMPAVGDCLKGELSAAHAERVPCGPEASYKVAAIEDGGALAGLTKAVCTKVPSAGASMEWKRQGSLSSKILCLEDLKNPANRRPAVGECMAPGPGDELHLAPCAKGAAKVLGQVEGLTKLDTVSKTVKEICKDFPGADQAASWSTQGSFTATTYCLQSVRK